MPANDNELLFGSNITIDRFLAEYWQRKPLLLRRAITGLDDLLTPDTLAGLACEQDSNARLVLESCGERPWSVEYGPFDAGRFSRLPATGWSLLVSDVERLLSPVLALQQRFRFIPDWRFDDVMFSYAPDGASVGAHIDAYDVFLLQTVGRRNWKISEHYRREFLESTDLEILRHFDAEQEWILEPGDMLYLPPDIAHHGIAVGACMTCSIGFRTPAAGQLAAEFIEYRAQYAEDSHYSDARLPRQQHPAEITGASLDKLREMIAGITAFSDAELARWFGEYISESRAGDGAEPDAASGAGMHHRPGARLLFTRVGDRALVFVDGASFETSAAFAEALCARRQVDGDSLRACMQAGDAAVLQQLLDDGYLVSDEA